VNQKLPLLSWGQDILSELLRQDIEVCPRWKADRTIPPVTMSPMRLGHRRIRRRQAGGGRGIQRAEAVFAGGGSVVDAAGLHWAGPDGKPGGVRNDPHVATLSLVLARVP